MDGDLQEPLEPIGFLARSEARVATLKLLQTDGPLSRRALNDRVPASRSTVTRTLSDFEERGWVERPDGGYRLTHIGEVIATSFLDLLESVRTTEELGAFLASFPYTDYDVDLAALQDATVTVATETEPFAPIRVHTESLEDANEYLALLPALVIDGKESVHERVQTGELEIEFVVTEAVAETMMSGEHASLFRSQLEHPNFEVYVEEATPSFFLSLIDDDLVQIGVADDRGSPTAMLESTNDEVLEWAEELYERIRSEAVALTLDAV